MTTRMTAARLARLIGAGDLPGVVEAVATSPALLRRTVEHEGTDGWTPLHLAVATGRADLVEALVDAGADLGARTEQGLTPLHVALGRALGLVEVLCRLGAEVDAPTAAWLGDVPRLEMFLDGGSPLLDPVTGTPLLSWAAHGGSVPAVRLLLARGAPAEVGALRTAVLAGRVDVVRVLLAAGADVHDRDAASGQSALHAAVTAPLTDDSARLVQLFLEAGADVDATTSDGATALDITRVAAARQRADSPGGTPEYEALGALLVAHGATH
ncbi:ankyrin repeat domain-containing protein [Modestobacter sp. I12A-02628]|uniref:Ankyrin repeat domain-containing protein n=1 Tax=Goekera deserti TaxID=2497753 RepID=A0A7K3W7K9_9ACTN|nr:ankyrin repeat domain-containing protein [Goekera deserti]MPQ99914.1 ankyrin repeat domain-containing protein [Goekera deserti]NDI50073.1 ankyrin repeat domain-containing protein [Goekera deserti]NEL52451.1 ankyrin repeat domain-containing protein [Goekera deserti]